MAATDRHHGKSGQIKMDPTGGSTLVAIVSLDYWDLDLATQKVKTTSFEDPNETYVIGRPDIKGTYKGFYDSVGSAVLFQAMQATVPPALELYPVATDTTKKWAGKGWMDGKVTVDSNGAVAIAGSFVAAGAWTWPA